MKLIIAYIQPHKLNDVKQALYKAEVFKMSVTNSLVSRPTFTFARASAASRTVSGESKVASCRNPP